MKQLTITEMKEILPALRMAQKEKNFLEYSKILAKVPEKQHAKIAELDISYIMVSDYVNKKGATNGVELVGEGGKQLGYWAYDSMTTPILEALMQYKKERGLNN